MSWQDIVLTIGQVLFIIALIPSLRSPDKPAIMTSVMTATILFVFSVVDLTLSLTFTSVVVFITGILWAILALQQWKRHRRGR